MGPAILVDNIKLPTPIIKTCAYWFFITKLQLGSVAVQHMIAKIGLFNYGATHNAIFVIHFKIPKWSHF